MRSGCRGEPFASLFRFHQEAPPTLIARLLAQQITQSSGQGFEVEYRPGAGTIVGTKKAVAKAAADGTTLRLIMANSFIINPILRSNLSYNPLTSFEPICLVGTSPQILAVNGASPYYKLADFVTAARAKPANCPLARTVRQQLSTSPPKCSNMRPTSI